MNFRKLLLISIPRDGENGAGAGAGGAGAGGAGAGGAGAGGAGAAGAGAGAAGAGAGAGGAAEPFYHSWGLDEAGIKFVNDRAFSDPKTLVKSAIEADTMARSRNVIEKPDPKKPGEWKGYSELGWVEDAAKYGVKPPAFDAAKGEVFDPQMHKDFVAASHELKLAPWQAEGVFNKMFATMNARVKEMETRGQGELAKLDADLRNEWGQDYDAKKTLAERALSTIGEKLKLDLTDKQALNSFMGSPKMVRMFNMIGEIMGEDTLRQGSGGGSPLGNKSPSAIEADLRKLENDPEFLTAMADQRHPLYRDMVDKRRGLITALAAAQNRNKAA
jgi:hypothetical protein